jgi:hypothetical protein
VTYRRRKSKLFIGACTVYLALRKSRTLQLLAFDEKSTFALFALLTI